jgi:hypothetical protein
MAGASVRPVCGAGSLLPGLTVCWRAVYVICRRGNDSQRATLLLQRALPTLTVRNVRGGVYAWRREVDAAFPSY